MSKMRIVWLGGAVGAAVLAGVLAKGFVTKKEKVAEPKIVTKVETKDVLVAARDIQMGEKLAAGSVTWKAWPKDNVLASMIPRRRCPTPRTNMPRPAPLYPCLRARPSTTRRSSSPALAAS